MSIYYVGPGGNNSNNGTTYALRRLTLTSVETLVAAGDTVRVAPGTYRETLTTTTNGSNGSPITYVGDEGGTLTDGAGGEIRVTGSDNDQTITRASGISVASNWRTFRGIHIDTATTGWNITGNNCIIEEFAAQCCSIGVNVNGASATNNTVRKGFILGMTTQGVQFTHTSTVDNSANVLENMVIRDVGSGNGVNDIRFGGINMRALNVSGCNAGVRVTTSPSGGQVNNLNDSVIYGNATGIRGVLSTDLTDDYNDVFANGADYSVISAGAHSHTYSPLFMLPLLTLGINVPYPGQLASYSQLGAIAGTSVPADDMYSTTRPGTPSWGAVQYESTRRPNNAGIQRGTR